MKNRKKPKYTMISDFKYAFTNLYHWDKKFFLGYLPTIPIDILISVLAIYFPGMMVSLIDKRASYSKATTVVVVYFVCLFLLSTIRRYCDSLIQRTRYKFSALYISMIREKGFITDYQNLDNPDFRNKQRLAEADAGSGNCSPDFFWMTILSFLSAILGSITYGGIILTFSPLVLLLLILSATGTYYIGKWQQNYTEKHKNTWTAIDRKIIYLKRMSQHFDYSKDIKLYGMSGWLSNILTGFQKERMEWSKKVSIRLFTGNVLTALMSLVRNGAAYTVLILLLLKHQISTGEFVFYFGAVTGFAEYMNGIANKFNEVVDRHIKIGYYRELFDYPEYFYHGSGHELPAVEEQSLEIVFDHVTYYYPEATEPTVKDLNFTLHKGEKLAIVGVNGAGKTTLIKLLCGFYMPQEGKITVNGIPVTEFNIEGYYTLFSAAFQDIHLLPITILQFVTSVDPQPDSGKCLECLRRAGLGEKIASLPKGMDTRLMKGTFEDCVDLSGGETQKLILARALYKPSGCIILDEPTAALDPIAENEMYLMYSELTSGKSSVYISHRLASTRFCDRILVLEKGCIIEEGTHNELIQHGGTYAYMYEVQSHYYREEVIINV